MEGLPQHWTSRQNLLLSGRFLLRLPIHLRRRLSLDEALRRQQDRLATREARFVAILQHSVFGFPASPYRFLFDQAGCCFGDVVRLIENDGIEETLRALSLAGIYVTSDEFKGRTDLRRGNAIFPSSSHRFYNPRISPALSASSGGSRSSGTPVFFDLAHIRDCAGNASLVLNARGGMTWKKATWEVPGGGSRFRLVKYASFGEVPVRWFSQVDPHSDALHPLYAWSTRAMRWGSWIAARPLPEPVYAPTASPEAVAEWIRSCLDRGTVPHLFSFPSSIVALANYVRSSGGTLEGAHFTVGGEPITQARLATIQQVGGDAMPRYGSVESAAIGYGCLLPSHPDEVHLLTDMHALIQNPGIAVPLPDRGLLLTSLHPLSPFVFINVSMGDEAELGGRDCGCPLSRLGWATHLHNIRSFEKLTGAGMTFYSTDLIRVLEEVLPQHFGGGPTDYQITECEKDGGAPEIRLSVHPRLGPLSEAEITHTFLESLGSSSMVHRLMGEAWREAGIVRVERTPPVPTKAGKILHVRLERR